jgi:hypothetical protein
MATHLLERGRKLCGLGLILEAGRLVFAGPSAEMPEPGGGGAELVEGA